MTYGEPEPKDFEVWQGEYAATCEYSPYSLFGHGKAGETFDEACHRLCLEKKLDMVPYYKHDAVRPSWFGIGFHRTRAEADYGWGPKTKWEMWS